jgi:hypothetical protein
MAGAAPAKKTQKEFTARHGIWLSPAGTLSFGLGMEDELLIEEATYKDIKSMGTEDRIKQYALIKNPPPPPAVVEAPAAAEVAPAAPEEVTEAVTAVPAAETATEVVQ